MLLTYSFPRDRNKNETYHILATSISNCPLWVRKGDRESNPSSNLLQSQGGAGPCFYPAQYCNQSNCTQFYDLLSTLTLTSSVKEIKVMCHPQFSEAHSLINSSFLNNSNYFLYVTFNVCSRDSLKIIQS